MITCFHCGEPSDLCVADVDGLLECESCHSNRLYAKSLADKARRERVEEAFQEQDARLERDGCYVPYDPPTPNLRVKQAGDK